MEWTPEQIALIERIRAELKALYATDPEVHHVKAEPVLWAVKCPGCDAIATLGHIEWSAIICEGCGAELRKDLPS